MVGIREVARPESTIAAHAGGPIVAGDDERRQGPRVARRSASPRHVSAKGRSAGTHTRARAALAKLAVELGAIGGINGGEQARREGVLGRPPDRDADVGKVGVHREGAVAAPRRRG